MRKPQASPYGWWIAVLIIVTVLYSFYRIRVEGFTSKKEPTYEVVVARYAEDLSWIRNIPFLANKAITIYNKGDPLKNKIPGAKIEKLPNIGREGHTYLHHIIENYDNLADITMFLPGSTWTFEQKRFQLNTMISYLQNGIYKSIIVGINDPKKVPLEFNFEISKYEPTSRENMKKNGEVYTQRAKIRPYGKWLDALFPGETIKCITYRGVVVATREDIQKRPKEFYQNLIKHLDSSNPEAGHFVERSWHLTLSVPDEMCVTGYFT
jgi:hypothetical protein